MFSRQAPQIDHSLWQGGLSAAQASVVANALGQCRAPIVHRAPVTVDYTSPEMRLITPESVQTRFPEMAITPPEVPPPRPPGFPPPEETPEEKPNPLPPKNPIGPIQPPEGAPGGGVTVVPIDNRADVDKLLKELAELKKEFENYKASYPDYTDGDYIEVDNDTSRVISLKTEDNSTDNICTFGVDEIKGVPFDDLLDDHGGHIIKVIRDENAGNPGSQVSVLTGVSLTAAGLEFRTKTLSVIEAGAEGSGPTIPVVDCP